MTCDAVWCLIYSIFVDPFIFSCVQITPTNIMFHEVNADDNNMNFIVSYLTLPVGKSMLIYKTRGHAV